MSATVGANAFFDARGARVREYGHPSGGSLLRKRASPLILQLRTNRCIAASEAMGQGTKSLRDSPLRGGLRQAQ